MLVGTALVFCVGMTNAKPAKIEPDETAWGKDANGLAVSIAPAKDAKDGETKFVVRWKNVGQETLELQWVRFGSNAIHKYRDDLLYHVSLKAPDGKLVPARQNKYPIVGGPPYRPRSVILAPDKILQETIDLWTYLDKPAGEGRYQLSISLEVKRGFAPSQKGAKYWTGKVESNVLEVKLAK
jgi:hypothetical protein